MRNHFAVDDLAAGFYTVPELAELLRISTITVYRMHERGVLPGTTLGGRVIFSKKAVADWLAANSKAGQSATAGDEGGDS